MLHLSDFERTDPASTDLPTLIDEAIARADQLSTPGPTRLPLASLSFTSEFLFKAAAYREILICRFADLAFAGGMAARSGKLVSTAMLTKSAFEMFMRLFELNDNLEHFVRTRDDAAFNDFLLLRIFGAQGGRMEVPGAMDVASAIHRLGEAVPSLTEVYEKLADISRRDFADDDGSVFEDVDQDQFTAYFNDAPYAGAALHRMVSTLVATEISFAHYYHVLERPFSSLGDTVKDKQLVS